jgi:L-lactate dehydrogenase complex protein LldE
MTIGLFIPCYVDQFYPKVAIATLELLESLGCDVRYPLNQTCCGQPMANSGFARLTGACDANFMANFKDFDYVVSPSGSCVLHIKEHLHAFESGKSAGGSLKPDIPNPQPEILRGGIFELTEFLTDVLKIEALPARFPHRVGYHVSCHGQRGLGLSSASEIVGEPFSKPLKLLKMVNDLELVTLKRNDECCGFGGTFCVTEEAVSVKMGKDRVAEHLAQNVEYIIGGDMSCLMHMEGILKRQNSTVKILHIAEILNTK